jgi:hypothetical protein
MDSRTPHRILDVQVHIPENAKSASVYLAERQMVVLPIVSVSQESSPYDRSVSMSLSSLVISNEILSDDILFMCVGY